MLTPKEQYEANTEKRKKRIEELKPLPKWYLRQRDPVARFTLYLAIASGLLFIIAGMQTCTLGSQLTEMQAEQRPWISFVGAPATDLFYQKDDPFKGLPTIIISTTFKNVGHLPAQHVYDVGQFFPWVDAAEPIRRRDSLCQRLESRMITAETNGLILMPNDIKAPALVLGMAQSDLDRWKKNEQSVPLIVGCIDYVFVTDNSHHRIGFIYELAKHGATPQSPHGHVRPTDGVVPKGSLVLDENPNLPWDIN